MGGVLGSVAPAGSTVNNSFSIRAGYLPSAVVLSLATNQMGYDLGFTVGAFIGGTNVNWGALGANNGGIANGFGTPGIDIRQVFGTAGTPEYGTFKVGRDLGLFAGQALLNDPTFFGLGVVSGNAAPGNTTLGLIGAGYVYPDFIPQFTYKSPDFYGFNVSVGVFSPYDEFNSTGFSPLGTPYVGFATSGQLTAHDQPSFQGQITYTGQLAPDVKLFAWSSGLTVLHRAEVGDIVGVTPGTSTRTNAVEAAHVSTGVSSPQPAMAITAVRLARLDCSSRASAPMGRLVSPMVGTGRRITPSSNASPSGARSGRAIWSRTTSTRPKPMIRIS